MNNPKTKRVDGVDLPASAFAYTGDTQNTSTWKLPICFRGDEKKTRNHVKDALYRFDQVKGIPDNERETVFNILRGAAMCIGLRVEPRKLTAKSEPPAAEPPPVTVPAKKPKDPEIEAAIVLADRKADELLRALGWE